LHQKKRKVIKKVVIHALLEDDLENIAYQVKEVTEEYFDLAAQKKEERHSDVKAQIDTL
jgi:hypothetical protein